MKALFVLAATVAALAGSAAPSHAIAVGPCEPGTVGVIVYDGNGELARACVRQ